MKKVYLSAICLIVTGLFFWNCSDSSSPNNPSPDDEVLSWIKTYGGSKNDYGKAVLQTDDDGFLIAGRTGSFENPVKMYVVKTNKSGEEAWYKTFTSGSSYSSEANSICKTSDGYVIAGSTTYGTSDIYIVKISSEGNAIWSKTYGGMQNYGSESVQPTKDNGFIVAGYTDVNGLYDIYLLKIDDSGNEIWSKTLGRSNYNEFSFCIKQTEDNGYILVGSSELEESNKGDALLMKTDPNGNELWSKVFSYPFSSSAYSIEITSDGGYAITGFLNDGAKSDVYLLRTDSSGNELWHRTFSFVNWISGYSVNVTNDNGFVIACGSQYGSSNDNTACILKTDSLGNEQWSKIYGAEVDFEHFFSVQQTIDNGFALIGSIYKNEIGNYDIYFVKTDSEGNVNVK